MAEERCESAEVLADARLQGIGESGDARGRLEATLHRAEQGERKQHPVLVAFAQQPRVGVARGDACFVCPAQHQQRGHRGLIKMSSTGVTADGVQAIDGGTRVGEDLFEAPKKQLH